MKGRLNYPALASLYLAVALLLGSILFCLTSSEEVWNTLGLIWMLALITSFVGLLLGGREWALRGSRAANWGCGLTLGWAAVVFLGSSVQLVREASTRMVLQENLKLLALAMHTYHEAQGQFPPAALCDKGGRPLLSWRVLLLPYLDQGDLYQQFKLDEPWDSPHNLPLQEKMPSIYELPDGFRGSGEPHATIFQVFVGPGTAFEGCEGTNYKKDFPDGASNTLLIITAEEAVPWTKPADLDYAPGRPLPALGVRLWLGTPNLFVSTPWVGLAFADGHSQCLDGRQVSEKTLRALITRNGKDEPGPDWQW